MADNEIRPLAQGARKNGNVIVRFLDPVLRKSSIDSFVYFDLYCWKAFRRYLIIKLAFGGKNIF